MAGLYENIHKKRARIKAGSMKDEKGRPTRKALALKKWKC